MARTGAVLVGIGVTVVVAGGCGSTPGGGPEATGAHSSTAVETTAPATSSRAGSVDASTTRRATRDGSPSPTVVYRPPYIDHVEWTDTAVGPSLSVFPTTSGRHTDDPAGMATAWQEVLALEPGADTPGMQAQFDCHWRFARIVDPEKASWNLEPGRPVVTEQEMISARCNPGFAEEY